MQHVISGRRARALALAASLMLIVPAAAQAHRGRGDRDGEHHVQRAALPLGAIDHIVVVELENESFTSTFGPGSPATYLNGTLLKQGELVPNYYATGHASLDNYISQISGQAPTEETSADCLGPSTNLTTLIGSYTDLLPGMLDPNQARYPGQVDGHGCIYPSPAQTIGNQLDRLYPPDRHTHRAAWRDYAQDMGNQPTGREVGVTDPLGGLDCGHPPLNGADNTNAATPSDQYATRHNGFMYFHSIIDNAAECAANVVPLGTVSVGTPSRLDGQMLADTFSGHLVQDFAHERTTPRFAWITPNLCNDGHDSTCAGPNTIGETGAGAGGLHGADEFLAHWMPALLASPAYRSGRTLIVVTFDEAGSGDAAHAAVRLPDPTIRRLGSRRCWRRSSRRSGCRSRIPPPAVGRSAPSCSTRGISSPGASTRPASTTTTPRCAATRTCSGSGGAGPTGGAISASPARPACGRSAPTCSTGCSGTDRGPPNSQETSARARPWTSGGTALLV